MANRTLVYVLDEKYGQSDSNDRKDEDEIPDMFPLKTILQTCMYVVNQVLDYHCCQTHSQTHKTR